MLRPTLIVLILAYCLDHSFAQSSIFASGQWYKIGVTRSGIYKIDRNYLSGLGIDAGQLDPHTLKVYGNGGGMLPELAGAPRPNGPQENAILGIGTGDGKMDNGDYFLFYGEGPDEVRYREDGEIVYEKNLYSDTTYYFLTLGGDAGKRLETRGSLPAPGISITSFPDHIIYEKDVHNLLESGRYWFDEQMSSHGVLTRKFHHTLPGVKDAAHIFVDVIAQSAGSCSFDILLNGQLLGNIPVGSIPSDKGTTYDIKGKENTASFTLPEGAAEMDLEIRFNEASIDPSVGYLDHYIITATRTLALYGNETIFRNTNAPGSYTYQLRAAGSGLKIWDITDPIAPVNQSFAPSGDQVLFTAAKETPTATFIAFSGADFPAPAYFSRIGNQDLKEKTSFDAVIITAGKFRTEAERLADFHRQHDNLSVEVVGIDEIYNEFSSGKQDISAIRDYLKYCWEKSGQLKYALLFGDCSYDPKYRSMFFTNYIPIYESRNVFSPVHTYSSDDFFGFLEDGEGEWPETLAGDHTLEIGIGRLPVKTMEEASGVVDKIIRYATSPRALGKWRNEVVYVSDDGDSNNHMEHAEELSAYLYEHYPQYRSEKIYLDAYEQEILPDERSPATSKAIKDAIADGAFIINYMGHGNEGLWMEEEVLTKFDIANLKNRQKLPLIVTATCEFGRYDEPLSNSGAEELLFNPDGGAIALVTTTRPVYAHTNLLVNRAFHESVFDKTNGEYPRLGDVIRITKNNSLNGVNNRNFALLGDPMLRLNYPQYDITINELEAEYDTLRALEKVTLTGNIQDASTVMTSFNGKAVMTIFDIPQERVTKGQQDDPFTYYEQSNALFRGEATVSNGEFAFSFVLPKNISYKFEEGTVYVYAWNEENVEDAVGASKKVLIGGTAANPGEDNTPPAVRLYLNEETFRNGGTVGPSSLLIASVFDQSGINISSTGFNQNITLSLNDGEPIVLNDYYTAEADSYQNGTILYPLQDLKPGKYTATIKIWDTYNNSATSQVEFKVSDQPMIRLFNVASYPNPVLSDRNVTFTFEHDRQGEKLVVDMAVYNTMGSVVSQWQYTIDDSPRKVDDLTWRSANNQGAPLEKGIYLYRMRVTSTLDGAYNEVVKRLLVIN